LSRRTEVITSTRLFSVVTSYENLSIIKNTRWFFLIVQS